LRRACACGEIGFELKSSVMLVKICGITNPDDAIIAEQAGADFIGTIFVRKSKRYVTAEQAQAILRSISHQAQPVALFQNEDIETITDVVTNLNYTIIQLHGKENEDYLSKLIDSLPQCKIIKVFFITGRETIDRMVRFYSNVHRQESIFAFLLDSASGGGTGEQFDWRKVSSALDRHRNNLPKIFLAGGLTPVNVREAIEIIRPDGVDISSGVEISAGKKDSNKVKQFISLAKGEI